MQRGIGRLRARSSGGLRTALITSLFGSGEQGAIYDYSDFSTLFQDSAGTTPVTATGQPVGKVLDLSGRGNHKTQGTSASRPTIEVDGNGKFYLQFDGFDDGMATASVNFTGSDRMTVWVGVRKDTDAALAALIELSAAGVFGADGTFLLAAPGGAAEASYTPFLRGTTTTPSNRASVYTAPITSVVSVQFNAGAGTVSTQIVPRVNAAVPTLTPSATPTTAANFGNHPIYFGRRGGVSIPFTGRLYSSIIRGTNSPTIGQIQAGETYANSKTGAY